MMERETNILQININSVNQDFNVVRSLSTIRNSVLKPYFIVCSLRKQVVSIQSMHSNYLFRVRNIKILMYIR